MLFAIPDELLSPSFFEPLMQEGHLSMSMVTGHLMYDERYSSFYDDLAIEFYANCNEYDHDEYLAAFKQFNDPEKVICELYQRGFYTLEDMEGFKEMYMISEIPPQGSSETIAKEATNEIDHNAQSEKRSKRNNAFIANADGIIPELNSKLKNNPENIKTDIDKDNKNNDISYDDDHDVI